jgi:glycosyltransferase involved in cell wall biosynthesis
MKIGKYDIYFITGKKTSKEYTYNSKIKRFIGYNNFTLMRQLAKTENIDFFILQNTLSAKTINFYKSLGKKVIGLFHGAFLSSLSHGSVSEFKNIINYDLLDSFIFVTPDDYYFYKNLGFKNEIYIPNLYTFEPNKTVNSNLIYNNIIMFGGENDTITGAKYAIKAMNLIVKEVHDAILTLFTSDGNVQYLIDLIKELNLANNIFINNHTNNISSYFLNSSIYMFTSIIDAFPISMNEGKAHGLPIIAFNVPYSPSYQNGVITVDQLDCEALAREIVYLLKDYNYRKRMGEYAKKSLNKYSNKETLDLWEKLFKSILSYDRNEYRELQDFIEKKYYDEQRARWNLQKHFDMLLRNNENLKCFSLGNFIDINFIKNIQDCK